MQKEFKYYFFGPLLFKSKIDNDFYTFLDKIVKNTYRNNLPFNHNIVKLEDEWELEKENDLPALQDYLEPYIASYTDFYFNSWAFFIDKNKETPKLKVSNAWVNYQKPYEYRDPHVHSNCQLSFVIYYDVPQEIHNESKNIITSSTPGSITFTDSIPQPLDTTIFPANHEVTILPEKGDVLIFPWYLTHRVIHFTSQVNRISIAGNISGIY